MKRFVSMLLALLLVFTCAACSSTKTEQTSDSAKTTAETAATETEASAGNTAASTDPIRIGVSAAITGAAVFTALCAVAFFIAPILRT